MMADTQEGWGWMATAIQIGTNDRMMKLGATRAEVDAQLYGRAYGAKADSVVYYRTPPESEAS